MSELSTLAKYAKQQLEAEHAVELAELELKAKKEALRVLQEETIPDFMEGNGIEAIDVTGGLHVEVKSTVRASIAKANLPKALEWLRKNGHDKLIKPKLVVVPDDDKHLATLAKRMAKLNTKDESGVNPQSLSKFVREMLEDGKSVPEKLLGVYRQRQSKITVNK